MTLKPPLLMDIAKRIQIIIDRADAAGVVVDDGNVIDLLADNIAIVPIEDLRAALVCSGHGSRFPKATQGRP